MLAANAGARTLAKSNISATLGRATGLAVRTGNGWELTADGRKHTAGLLASLGQVTSPTPKLVTNLRGFLGKLTNPDTRAFVKEAISCLEGRHLRAAVVLSWVGALSVLQENVFRNHLGAFNMEATRRDPKWKPVKTKDDFGKMKESTFLDILENLSVIGGNVKKELKNCLELRNSCGHPNSLSIGENRAAAHMELLILNVFVRFI
jgi:hypothetical protein